MLSTLAYVSTRLLWLLPIFLVICQKRITWNLLLKFFCVSTGCCVFSKATKRVLMRVESLGYICSAHAPAPSAVTKTKQKHSLRNPRCVNEHKHFARLQYYLHFYYRPTWGWIIFQVLDFITLVSIVHESVYVYWLRYNSSPRKPLPREDSLPSTSGTVIWFNVLLEIMFWF